jgi:AraC-like DNA-binding protein
MLRFEVQTSIPSKSRSTMTKKFVVNTAQLPGIDSAEKFAAMTEHRAWDFEVSDAPFRAHMEIKSFADVEVSRVDGSLINCTRTTQQIAADGDDRIAVMMSYTAARGLTVQSGREIETNGGFTAVSLAEPAHLALSLPVNRWIRILMPSRALAARAPRVQDMMARSLFDHQGVLSLLFAYAGFVLDNDAIGEGQSGELAASHCNDLAALAFAALGDEAEAATLGGLRAVRFSRVVNRIRERFTDPSLSIGAVAQHFALSERYVHRLLQESGKSFSERVLTLRLETARAVLARDPSQGIADTAYAVGFSDLSYFNRCFRRRYGVTPSAARGG